MLKELLNVMNTLADYVKEMTVALRDLQKRVERLEKETKCVDMRT